MTEEDVMGKHRSRSEERLMRQWRACGVLSLAGVVAFVALYVTMRFLHKEDADEQHVHHHAPHGGVIVSAGDDEGHHHVEVLADRGHTLRLYTYGKDLQELLAVEHQILTAQVKPEVSAQATPVVLMPMPQRGDGEGKTSRFFGKLPDELRGKKLIVHIPDINLAGRRFQLNFMAVGPEKPGDRSSDHGDEDEKLLLSAGGKYTEEDIQANGGMTALRKYREFPLSHEVRPRPGEQLCPVSRIKAHREFSWVVAGRTYMFCCPPCVEEFVRRAKEQPQEIKAPDEYVQK
jgi:hypothetical protein